MTNRPYNCIHCGKFIKWTDFDDGKAASIFIPDSEVSQEQDYAWHLQCAEDRNKCHKCGHKGPHVRKLHCTICDGCRVVLENYYGQRVINVNVLGDID